MKKQTDSEPCPDSDNEEVRTEIQQYLAIRQQRRWIFPRAALVGFCAGLVALLFRIGLTHADGLRDELIEPEFPRKCNYEGITSWNAAMIVRWMGLVSV